MYSFILFYIFIYLFTIVLGILLKPQYQYVFL